MAIPATLQHPFPYAPGLPWPPPPLTRTAMAGMGLSGRRPALDRPLLWKSAPKGPPPPPGNKLPPARASALAPPAKNMATSPYVAFCREQRPLLPARLRNAEREQTLGMRTGHVDIVLTRRAMKPRGSGVAAWALPVALLYSSPACIALDSLPEARGIYSLRRGPGRGRGSEGFTSTAERYTSGAARA